MGCSVRLACLRHAASVHPEPGSNSPKKFVSLFFSLTLWINVLLSFQRSFCFLRESTINIPNVFTQVNTFFTLFSFFYIFFIFVFFMYQISNKVTLIYHFYYPLSICFFHFFLLFISTLLLYCWLYKKAKKKLATTYLRLHYCRR